MFSIMRDLLIPAIFLVMIVVMCISAKKVK